MNEIFNPKLTWNTLNDDCINDFYKPALKNCIKYQRASGFFSSSTFSHIAAEIIEFIERDGKIELIISPKLSEIDREIFENSIEKIKNNFEVELLKEIKNSANLELEFTKILGYMLRHKINDKPQLEVKIAIPRYSTGIFHMKIGIFHYDDDVKIAFSGSINETGSGWAENEESFSVFKDWGDKTNQEGVTDNQIIFNDLWHNQDRKMYVYDLPNAINEHLLEISPKSDEDAKKIISNIKKRLIENKDHKNRIRKSADTELINKNEDNTIDFFKHQNEAIESWKNNNMCGLFEMATGTGKTITAFGCINEMQDKFDRTVTIIAAPYKHLTEQWRNNFNKYNIDFKEEKRIFSDATIICNSDNPNWKKDFDRLIYKFNKKPIGSDLYSFNQLVIFATHDTMNSSDFSQRIEQLKDTKKLLIVDEVHEITENRAEISLSQDYEFRIGLSATPDRHMDLEGTQILKNYFHSFECNTINSGDAKICQKCQKPLIVYSLDLETAIHKLHVLCTYEYYPFYVELTQEEMSIYIDLSRQIAQVEQKRKKGIPITKKDRFPYLARANLIANAENKDHKLEEIIQFEFNKQMEKTLVYCTNTPRTESDKDALTQLQRAKKILFRNGIKSDSVTHLDKTELKMDILEDLEIGIIDCVTAVNCLDQGLDIPAVKNAIIMASTGNPKQYIQRRGRVLRIDKRTNKFSAKIYDILVAPPLPQIDEELRNSEKKIFAKELLRHKEFARISNNFSDSKITMKEIASKYGIDYDLLDANYIKDELS